MFAGTDASPTVQALGIGQTHVVRDLCHFEMVVKNGRVVPCSRAVFGWSLMMVLVKDGALVVNENFRGDCYLSNRVITSR